MRSYGGTSNFYQLYPQYNQRRSYETTTVDQTWCDANPTRCFFCKQGRPSFCEGGTPEIGPGGPFSEQMLASILEFIDKLFAYIMNTFTGSLGNIQFPPVVSGRVRRYASAYPAG